MRPAKAFRVAIGLTKDRKNAFFITCKNFKSQWTKSGNVYIKVHTTKKARNSKGIKEAERKGSQVAVTELYQGK